jgi:hypothetical protein
MSLEEHRLFGLFAAQEPQLAPGVTCYGCCPVPHFSRPRQQEVATSTLFRCHLVGSRWEVSAVGFISRGYLTYPKLLIRTADRLSTVSQHPATCALPRSPEFLCDEQEMIPFIAYQRRCGLPSVSTGYAVETCSICSVFAGHPRCLHDVPHTLGTAQKGVLIDISTDEL